MKGTLTIILTAAVVTGCATHGTDVPWTMISSSWEGKDIEALIERWGEPSAVERSPGGQRSVFFEESWYPDTAWTEYRCGVRFDTNAQGIVESHEIYGNFGGCSRFFKPESLL